MKILLRIVLDIIVLTILLSIFGDIYGKDPFLSLSIYLMLLAVIYFSVTIVTLPLSSLAYSSSVVMLCACLLGAAIVSEIIWPSPELITPSLDEMGNHPLAEWTLFIQNDDNDFATFHFTGTTEESKIAIDLMIKKWNREHPDLHPIIKHQRSLTWIPPEHIKKHNYNQDRCEYFYRR